MSRCRFRLGRRPTARGAALAAGRGLGRAVAGRRGVVGRAGAGPALAFQVVGVDGRAWLLVCGADGWRVEAAYD